MAKRTSRASKAQSPESATIPRVKAQPKAVPTMNEIEQSLGDVLCSLTCADAVLYHSAGDQGEKFACAHNVIYRCVKDLEGLRSALDIWTSHTRTAAAPPPFISISIPLSN